MSKTFEVGWTFGGYTTVEAESPAEARRLFDSMDHHKILAEHTSDDSGGLDVVDITESDRSTF